MKNKKISLLALSMLMLGAIGSIAFQSHAAQIPAQTPVQTSVSSSLSDQTDLTVDQKDAQGVDLETADDSKEVLGAENESANDNDSDSASEQNESGSNQPEAGE